MTDIIKPPPIEEAINDLNLRIGRMTHDALVAIAVGIFRFHHRRLGVVRMLLGHHHAFPRQVLRSRAVNEQQHKELLADADRRVLENFPGYPWLPCPICNGVEGCDHSVPERAKAFNPAIHMNF